MYTRRVCTQRRDQVHNEDHAAERRATKKNRGRAAREHLHYSFRSPLGPNASSLYAFLGSDLSLHLLVLFFDYRCLSVPLSAHAQGHLVTSRCLGEHLSGSGRPYQSEKRVGMTARTILGGLPCLFPHFHTPRLPPAWHFAQDVAKEQEVRKQTHCRDMTRQRLEPWSDAGERHAQASRSTTVSCRPQRRRVREMGRTQRRARAQDAFTGDNVICAASGLTTSLPFDCNVALANWEPPVVAPARAWSGRCWARAALRHSLHPAGGQLGE